MPPERAACMVYHSDTDDKQKKADVFLNVTRVRSGICRSDTSFVIGDVSPTPLLNLLAGLYGDFIRRDYSLRDDLMRLYVTSMTTSRWEVMIPPGLKTPRIAL